MCELGSGCTPLWQTTCEGLRTQCNDGGVCCAFDGGRCDGPYKRPREEEHAPDPPTWRARRKRRPKPHKPPRSPPHEPAAPEKHPGVGGVCDWPFGCPHDCADPGLEEPKKEDSSSRGWGNLLEKDPPELQPYNPPAPCGIGYPCGYRSRGKLYMPGPPGQVFPRVPCQPVPVCRPVCAPSPCRPCVPCKPCDAPGQGKERKSHGMAMAAPSLPTSVSAIVALSLLAANHATGSCSCPSPEEQWPPPAAASRPPTGYPSAAINTQGFPGGAGCCAPASADRRVPPCLRPAQSEECCQKTPGFRLAGGAEYSDNSHSEIRFNSKHQEKSHNPATQPSDEKDNWEEEKAIPGVYPGKLEPRPGMYPPWLGCGPYLTSCYPHQPPMPTCVPGIGALMGKAPQCFLENTNPENAVAAADSSRTLGSTEGAKSEIQNETSNKHNNSRLKAPTDTKSNKNNLNNTDRNKQGGVNWVSHIADGNNPEKPAAGTTVDPVKNGGAGGGKHAACGCARRHGPCPAHCLQPKPLGSDQDEKKRRERNRRRLAVKQPSCPLPLVLPYQHKRSHRTLACHLKDAGGSANACKDTEDKRPKDIEDKHPKDTEDKQSKDIEKKEEAKDNGSCPQERKGDVGVEEAEQEQTAPSQPSTPKESPKDDPPVDGWSIPYITPFHVSPEPHAHETSHVPSIAHNITEVPSTTGSTGVHSMKCRPECDNVPQTPSAFTTGPTTPTPTGPGGAPGAHFGNAEERREHPRSRPHSQQRRADACPTACDNCPVRPDGCGPAATRAAGYTDIPKERGPCFPKPPPPAPPPPLPCGQLPTDPASAAAATCTKDLEAGQLPPCLQPKTMICKFTPLTRTLMCYERQPRPCVADSALCAVPGSCWGTKPTPQPPPNNGFMRRQIWPPPTCSNADGLGMDGDPARLRRRRPKDSGCIAQQQKDDCPTFSHCLAEANNQ